MKFATFEGNRISYRRDGSGPALVLVHGTGGDGEGNWRDVAAELSTDHTVIRPDYSGSGETEDDGRDLSVEYLAQQVLAVADDAGLSTFALAGFSLGAAVTARIAADYPNRISDLVLIAGFLSPDPRLTLQFELWRDLITSDRSALARLILLTGFRPDALSSLGDQGLSEALANIIENQNWPGMARQIEVDLALDVRDVVDKITSRALVIGNTYDHMVPPSHSKAIAAGLDRADYVELPSGHLAPMERPGQIAQTIRQFLKDK